jgi:branched-chain amino acid aminotransferase
MIECKHIWLDGRIVPAAEAVVPFMTPALHYGTAVFEGIRAYQTPRGPAVFRIREHMERLHASCKVFGWKALPYEVDELVEAAKATIAANELEECYVRPLVWQDGGGWNLNIDGGRPRIGISAWAWNAYLGEEAIEHGVRANVSSFTRHHPNVMMTKAKIAGNYPNSVLAKTESVRLGFDEAIMLDTQGFVAECTGENIFLVKGDRVTTTPPATILQGITRDSLMTLAAAMGIEIVEQPMTRDQLYIADEVFVCGTAAEVIGLREIDHRVIGSGTTGPVTRRLQTAYHTALRGGHPCSADWLDYVYPETSAQRVAS